MTEIRIRLDAETVRRLDRVRGAALVPVSRPVAAAYMLTQALADVVVLKPSKMKAKRT